MAHPGEDLHQHAGIMSRLRALGAHPVDPVVAARHAALMSSVSSEAPVPRRRFRPVVVGGLVAGSLFGSVGLAGALTGSPLAPARAVLQTVGLMGEADENAGAADRAADAGKTEPAVDEVDAQKVDGSGPEGQVGPAEPGERGVDRESCDGSTGTHGQWVRSNPDDAETTEVNERRQAAQEDCGMPVPSTQNPGAVGAGQPEPGPAVSGGPPDDGGPQAGTGPGDAGRPPHAGRPSDVGTGVDPDGAPGPPGAPGNKPTGAGAGEGNAGP